MMAEAYGRAVMEERLRPRRHAELAAYVRHEYGSGTGPGFLLAEIANGGAWGPPKRRGIAGRRFLAGIAKALKAFVVGNSRKAEMPEPAR